MATDPSFDVDRAHRWFAVECNNLAWDLVEKPDRTVEEAERMIHAAHTSLWHWRKVGTEINHLRARCLLATSYLAADNYDTAVRYADQCVELSERLGDVQTTFDRAVVYGCAAKAHREHVSVYRELANQYASLLAEEERSVFMRLYA